MPEQTIPTLKTDGFVSKNTGAARPKRSEERESAAWNAIPAVRLQNQIVGHEFSRRPIVIAPRRAQSEAEEDRKTTGLLIKLGVCAAVCVLALGLKLVNTPQAAQIAQDVKQVLTAEIDVNETIGKLKFVDSNAVSDDTTMVFGTAGVTLPVQGEVRQPFGEGGSDGIVFACTKGAVGVACADGVVEAIGTDEARGQYVRVRHIAGLETFLYGLANVAVEKGQPLKSGDVLGKAAGESLYFEARVNGAPQDPMKLYEAAKN